MPASARVSARSMPKRSWCSGETVQMMALKTGLAASSLLPPAIASPMRMRLRASQSSFMLTTMWCFSELRMQASNSCSMRVSAGQSWAETTAEVADTLGIACTTLAQSARSCLHDERTLPSNSRRKTPQPSEEM